jgi:hypothetical protein
MEIVQANLWLSQPLPVIIVVTTNATIKSNGALVMGRGAALEAKQRAPEIPMQCGRAIQRYMLRNHLARTQNMYGFLPVRPWNKPGKVGFGIFQVKKEFNQKAELPLINYSCQTLAQWVRQTEFACPVRMNFPGIGNGGLPRDIVEPILWAHFKDMPITICVK